MNPPRILVADDSRTIRAVVHRILSGAGFDVILASDGAHAVQLARRERPHLVILDIQMPVMDGYAACEEILALEDRYDDLPIVFLTNDTANHLGTLGNQLGAYLPKPVDEETLVATVRSLLKSHSVEPAC